MCIYSVESKNLAKAVMFCDAQAMLCGTRKQNICILLCSLLQTVQKIARLYWNLFLDCAFYYCLSICIMATVRIILRGQNYTA